MLEETVVKQIREARFGCTQREELEKYALRRSSPSILYMPHADRWWASIGNEAFTFLAFARNRPTV